MPQSKSPSKPQLAQLIASKLHSFFDAYELSVKPARGCIGLFSSDCPDARKKLHLCRKKFGRDNLTKLLSFSGQDDATLKESLIKHFEKSALLSLYKILEPKAEQAAIFPPTDPPPNATNISVTIGHF